MLPCPTDLLKSVAFVVPLVERPFGYWSSRCSTRILPTDTLVAFIAPARSDTLSGFDHCLSGRFPADETVHGFLQEDYVKLGARKFAFKNNIITKKKQGIA
jgi:hypothetical protein